MDREKRTADSVGLGLVSGPGTGLLFGIVLDQIVLVLLLGVRIRAPDRADQGTGENRHLREGVTVRIRPQPLGSRPPARGRGAWVLLLQGSR